MVPVVDVAIALVWRIKCFGRKLCIKKNNKLDAQ
jgi:hypothetical protein